MSGLFFIFTEIQYMLSFAFMRNAFISGTAIALTAGVIGYFMVLRGQSFAGHTISQTGFAGASGAALLGISPFAGLLGFTILAAFGAGSAGNKRTQNADVAIGVILTLSLGLGVLFMNINPAFAGDTMSILFGETLGVSSSDIAITIGLSAAALFIIALIGRPLLYVSIDPDSAIAHGVPARTLSILFLLLLAVTIAEAAQIVGVLLVFALLATSSAAAGLATGRPGLAITLSAALAVVFVWFGLIASFFTPYPVGFYITTAAFVTYETVRFIHGRGSPVRANK